MNSRPEPAPRASVVTAAAPEAALAALFQPFVGGELAFPASGDVLFLGARAGAALREHASADWLCEQSFAPFADELARCGLRVGEAAPDQRFGCVLVLPPRQRDAARAQLARALGHVADDGVVVVAVPNAEGAKTVEGDLVRLAGTVAHLSKHKCRVVWTTPAEARVDAALAAEWRAFDAPRANADGWWSRPGLFAWDRVDRASALLAAHLPADLAGPVADLGAGCGYLASAVVARCPGVAAIDLYEAESRALEPARRNLAQSVARAGREVAVGFHNQDVTRGLARRYASVVMNPPFHQGRADLPGLGQAFIRAAAGALVAPGRLLLVANRHLPYEGVLAEHFAEFRPLAQADGFKLIEARGVRA